MNLLHRILFVGLLAGLVLTGCQQPLSTNTPAPTNTAIAYATPSPTVTPLLATLTPTSTSSPTSTPTLTSTVQPAAGGYVIVFVGETVPDGTNLQPGQAFRKSWTLKNGGARAWTEGFALAVNSSNPKIDKLGSPETVLVGKVVQPGESIEISVDLVAPQQEGRYTVYYELNDETGAPVPDSQIWVTITVGAVSSPGSSGTGNVYAQLSDASMENGEYSVSFCTQLPDSRAWYPWNVILLVDQQSVFPSGSRSDPATALTANKCFTFYFPTNGIEPGGSAQLSIGKVELPPEVHQEENCANAHAALTAAYPGLDFSCTVRGCFTPIW